MAIQYVGVGNAPNDHFGDPLRDAFIKINSNFAELDGSLSGMQISITNIEGDITLIQADIVDIETDITTIQSDIDNLQLDSLTDVAIVGPLNEEVLTFESSSGLWKNKPSSGGVIPVFTPSTDGLVPAPITVSGRVLSDNGTWIIMSGGGSTTDLGYTAAPTQGTITNTNGTPAVIPLADNTNAGLLSPTDLAKINTAIQTIVPGTNISVNSADPANPIVSAIPSTSAGVFDRVYFTGQVASVATPIGPNYDSIRNGKGSVASVPLVVGGLNASTKLYIPNDIIGPAQIVAGTLPIGNYTSFLSVQASAAISLKRFTIEVFLCDSAGVIIPSTGPVSGSTDPFYAGKNTVVILDSGDLNLANDDVTQIGLTGYLASPIPVAIGQRFRYHISVARGAGGGGAQTMTVYIGNTANSYVEAPIPINTTTVVNLSNVPGATATDALNALNTADSLRTVWKGNWIAGTYQKNDQVLDNSFLTIANKITTDRPAPQPIGTPGYVYAAPTIPTTSINAKQVIFGNRYAFTKDVILEAWRVNVIAGNSYSIYLVENPLVTPIISQIINYTAQRSGWIPLNVPKTIIRSGSTYDLVATVSQPAVTPVTFTANYSYKKPTNSTTPNAGDITQANNLTTTLRISKTDNNAIDRSAQLGALVTGDKITGDNTIWAIQSVTDGGSFFSFVVSPATQLASTGVKTFIFETVALAPITYPLNTNYWSTNPPVGITAQGLLAINASYFGIVPNTTAYGTDILVQDIVPSADWDIQAFSETSAGGDGNTDLSYTASPTNGIVVSSTGNDATIPLVDNTNAGLMAPAEHIKLASAISASSTDTLTNKGIVKRTDTIPAAATSYTLNCDSFDVGQADPGGLSAVVPIVFNTPTGAPSANQLILYHLKDSGTARTLNFSTSTAFVSTFDFVLPTTTIAGKWIKILFMWNSVLTKWECVSIVNSN